MARQRDDQQTGATLGLGISYHRNAKSMITDIDASNEQRKQGIRPMVKSSSLRRPRRKRGNALAIPDGFGGWFFGRELSKPLIGFYDLRSKNLLEPTQILGTPILFKVFVSDYAITDHIWRRIGWKPLEPDLSRPVDFFTQDALSGQLKIYKQGGLTIPATEDMVEGLECAAVWDPQHVEERLKDHYAGRSNRWFDSLRPT